MRRLTTLEFGVTKITDAAPLAALVGLTKLAYRRTVLPDAPGSTVDALRARGVKVIGP